MEQAEHRSTSTSPSQETSSRGWPQELQHSFCTLFSDCESGLRSRLSGTAVVEAELFISSPFKKGLDNGVID